MKMSSHISKHLFLLSTSKSASKILLTSTRNYDKHSAFPPSIFNSTISKRNQAYAANRPITQSAPSSDVTLSGKGNKKTIVPTFRKASLFPDSIALRDQHGDYTYRGLFESSKMFASVLSNELAGKMQERVAFLCPNDANYLISQWACSMSGLIGVPLCALHPPTMLEYFVTDSDSKVIVTTKEYVSLLEGLAKKTGRKLIVIDDSLRTNAMIKLSKKPSLSSEVNEQTPSVVSVDNSAVIKNDSPLEGGLDPELYSCLDAFIIYTSGSTGSPKGVIYSYSNLEAQILSLVKAWKWSSKDIILHALPLHHIHGTVNALFCPLHVGARCVMLPAFDAAQVWTYLLALKQTPEERANIFMGVPTMYVKLIEEYEKVLQKTERMVEYVKAHCEQKVRLMVSGSAPLPTPVFDRWEQITGHKLLERYGMTETGMVLSNPLEGERRPGFVGHPLPGVSVRIVKEDADKTRTIISEGSESGTKILAQPKEEIRGSLEVKGDSVFSSYWRKPEATKREFTADGWFKTGDVASYEDGAYKLLGRSSVDLIKTGGYKVSALSIETSLLAHPNIIDVSVVGLPDITWGQKVAALIVVKSGQEITLSTLREWAKERIPPYAVPTVMKLIDKIPRNAMGKTNKKQIVSELFPEHKKN